MTKDQMIMPGATMGIIGGGQLGQMMALNAKQNGMHTLVLDPTPACPAGQCADDQLVADYNDRGAIEELARRADVLTYEFENVDLAALRAVADQVAIPQGTALLATTKDRLREKNFLNAAGLATAPFRAVPDESALAAALADLGYPCVLKTTEGGYDGHGQVVLKGQADLPAAKELAKGAPCILEGWVNFDLECSVMVARNGAGEVVTLPVAENVHRNEILHLSIVPARMSPELRTRARGMAVRIAKHLQLRGILGVEMFVAHSGEIYVNELAPRPHNSGHYSIEACDFSQFALHNRAVWDWPLPKPTLLKPAVMVNVLGQHVAGVQRLINKKPDWHFHDYGKAVARPNRKMGHVTILTADPAATLQEIAATGIWND